MKGEIVMGTKTGTGQKQSSFWTDSRVERLRRWYNEYKDREDVYLRVAKRLNTTKDAVYKKLGREGMLDASWAAQYRQRSRSKSRSKS